MHRFFMKGLGSRLSWIVFFQGEECVDDLFCDFATGEDGAEVEGRDAILDGDELSMICLFNFALIFF